MTAIPMRPRKGPQPPVVTETAEFVDLAAAYRAAKGERDWFARGAIEGTPITLLIGPEKTNKSWALADLAVATATGGKWLGTFEIAKPGDVVIIDAEYGADEYARRTARLARGRGRSPEEVFARLRYVRGAQSLALQKNDPLLLAHFASVKASPPALIIVDPLRNLLPPGADENSAADIIGAFYVLSALRGVGDCPVVVAHHLNKSGGASGSRALQTRADLVLTGTDEERPTYSTIGRRLRKNDAIQKRFTLRVGHTDDDDDRIATTTIGLRYEGEATSREELSKTARRILAVLSDGDAYGPTAISKASGVTNTQARDRGLRELASAGLVARSREGKWSLTTAEVFRSIGPEGVPS